MTGFRDALLGEVIPMVEKNYRVSKDRRMRAIAGLSMGGAESLFTGLNAIDRFAWVGAFSSGGPQPGPGPDVSETGRRPGRAPETALDRLRENRTA